VGEDQDDFEILKSQPHKNPQGVLNKKAGRSLLSIW
jgi:hypothetical protein